MTSEADREHLRILVVDDESLIAMAVHDQLEFLGHEVVGDASSALEAIDLARELEPDLIVMDIHLGGMDGLEAASRINARKRTPVVILTGFPDKVLVDRGKECGVVAHLVKPIDIEDLRQAVQRGWLAFQTGQNAG
ncbi:MAG: response regulator [Chloroflexi bacterium]|nr:response regulator [Chloroflexota bacterium]